MKPFKTHYSSAGVGACVLLGLAGASPARAQLSFYQNQAAFNGASVTSLLEDFESISPKNTALASFTHNGVVYSGVGSSNVYVAAPGFSNFGTPITTTSILTSSGNEDFLMTFAIGKEAIGFDTYTNTFGPVRVEAFGASGSLGIYSLTQDSTKIGFLGITSGSALITSVRWTGVNGNIINTGIDNIRVGSNAAASAPEPSTLWLLAFPAAGSVLRLRARKSRR